MPKQGKNTSSDLVLHQDYQHISTQVQLKATGDTKLNDQAVERARLLMSVSPAVESEPIEVQHLRDQITEPTEHVAALTTRHPASQWKKSIRCFNCDGIGHVQCDCPSPRRHRSNIGPCNNCGRFGQVLHIWHISIQATQIW